MPETYQEELTRASGIAEAYKNSKGTIGARNSKSCFQIAPGKQTMIMFVEPKPADRDQIPTAVRKALFITGINNGVTEAQETYELVTTTAGNPSALTLALRPSVVDEIVAFQPAIAPEKLLLKYKQGRLLVYFGQPALGRQMQVEANSDAGRYGINFDQWSDDQLVSGKGPNVGPTGIPVLPLSLQLLG